MEVVMSAIATAVPQYCRQQDEIADFLIQRFQLSPAEQRLLKAVYRQSGIQQRYSVLSDGFVSERPVTFFDHAAQGSLPTTKARMGIYRQEAFNLAESAARACLEKRKISSQTVTHLITVSCTGMYAPGIDIELIQALGLSAHTQRTAIQFMGCYAAFNALKLAEHICQANHEARVLVVCVELCSLHYQHQMTKDNLIANAIFADGAAAVLVESLANAAHVPLVLGFKKFRCALLPSSEKAMAWEIGDNGFDIVLSSYVAQAIESGIGQFLQDFIRDEHVSLSEIDHYAIHPGGIKILAACEAALGLEPESQRHAYQVLSRYGNMSSATILFVLRSLWDELLQTGKQDQTIFSAAFGPGLTLESMLLTTKRL